MSDLNCTLHALNVHPLKSCAVVAVSRCTLLDTGLEYDREWMLVDEQREFVTQRDLPLLAMVRPQMRHQDVVLRAPGMLALHLSLHSVGEPLRVRVWDDWVGAFDMGDLAAQWFSDFAGRKLRLVRFDPDAERLSAARWTGAVAARTLFSDGFAVLVTSTASLAELNRRLALLGQPAVDLRRLRPNLVLEGIEAHDEDHIDTLQIDTAQGRVVLKLVKPCERCTIPGVDPDTGVQGHAVTDALAAYRSDARVGGAITFGMNAIVLEGAGLELAVGQRVQATYRFG